MGKRGPKPAPTALKEARGNPGRRPLNVLEPKPRAGLPRMPAWLPPKGKTVWKSLGPELVRARLLTHLDGFTFSLACEVWCVVRDAITAFRDKGFTEETPNHFTQSSPEWTALRQAIQLWLQFSARFGLSPADRVGLSVDIPRDEGLLKQWMLKSLERRSRVGEKSGS